MEIIRVNSLEVKGCQQIDLFVSARTTDASGMILTYLWQWQHPLPTTGYREIIQIVCRLPLTFVS